MDKLVGFTISKNKVDHDDFDIFKRGLNKAEFQKNGFNIYLWGIGDIKNNCLVNEKYSLSFPINENLLDRNVLIFFVGKNIIIENDWLGSIPVFYNEKELIVSTLPLKALKDKRIDPEGLNIYFEFGYCVFGHTPFVDVNFLRYFSKILINEDKFIIEHKEDPVTKKGLFDKTQDEREVFKKIGQYINKVEEKTVDEIILPTSGGHDSRILNFLIKDKDRIRSFTYGASKDQSRSYEVVYASELSKNLRIKWQQIELGYFYNYINDWFKLYGFSTHLHGMYHIEFYKKIVEKYDFSKNATFLSGIVGDVWAGKAKIYPINNYRGLLNLGYSHGNNLNRIYFPLHSGELIKRNFFLQWGNLLRDDRLRIIAAIRFKLMLLSYLVSLPEYFGFPVWTPFLNYDIAISILSINKERRKNRIWQKEFFKRHGLNLEDFKLAVDKNNYLMYGAFLNYNFSPIDTDIMQSYLSKKYLKKINDYMMNRKIVLKFKNRAFANRHFRAASYRIFDIRPAYIDYLVIKSIEKALKY